jgi:hypothetical protein
MLQKNRLKFFLISAIALLFGASFCRAEMSKIYDFGFKEGLKGITLNWRKSALAETESFVLLKKEGACPKFYRDGEEIYRGNGNEYTDREIRKNKKYCYGLYVSDLSGRSSEIKLAGLAEKSGWLKYGTDILMAGNNYFIALEVVVFLLLIWLNLKKRGYFEKERKLKIIRVDEK